MINWDTESKRKPVVIFAIAEPAGISPDTQHGWFLSWCKDRGIPVKPLDGCYKGKEERSYLMYADMEPRLWQTWCKGQESILFLTGKVPGGYRQASLHYRDGKQEAIGQWREVERKTAYADCEAGKGYTRDPLNATYWRAS